MALVKIHAIVIEGEEAVETEKTRKGLTAERANAIMAKLNTLIREELDAPLAQSPTGATLP